MGNTLCEECRDNIHPVAKYSGENVHTKTLLKAIQQGHHECVQALIKAGADVNATSYGGDTPLIHAIENGRFKCAEFLILAGADVNKRSLNLMKGSTPLSRAVICNERTCLELLLNSGADVNHGGNEGKTPLMHCVDYDNAEFAAKLIEKGASVNTALSHAVQKNEIAFVEQFIKAGADVYTALSDAAQNNDLSCAQILIEAGADVNASNDQGITPLMKAVEFPNSPLVDYLLVLGADVNRTGKMWSVERITALMKAAMRGNVEHVKKLLEFGADVNLVDSYGTSALLLAAKGCTACVKALIEAGADVNLKDSFGNTPLLRATANENVDCIKLLLQAGAHVNIENKVHHNALEHHFLHSDVIDVNIAYLLLAAGEIMSDTTLRKSQSAQHFQLPISDIKVADYIKERSDDCKLHLKHICREAIRSHLINLDPSSHLFRRVPRLGLPQVLTQYLLYDMSLDIESPEYAD